MGHIILTTSELRQPIYQVMMIFLILAFILPCAIANLVPLANKEKYDLYVEWFGCIDLQMPMYPECKDFENYGLCKDDSAMKNCLKTCGDCDAARAARSIDIKMRGKESIRKMQKKLDEGKL